MLLNTPAYTQENIPDREFEDRFSNSAVSKVNGKISLGYKYTDRAFGDPIFVNNPFGIFGALDFFDRFDGAFLEASLALPVGDSLGVQIDGFLHDRDTDGPVSRKQIYGLGGHVFSRDPDTGLFGIYAGFVEQEDAFLTSQSIALEAEFYLDNMSLEFLAGADVLEIDDGLFSTSATETFFAGEAVAAFYPNENLRLYGGVAHNFEETRALAGVEWQVSDDLQAPTLFAKAELGEDFTSVAAGISFFFWGDNKSLIRRHREDGVQNRLQDNLAAADRCGQQIVVESFFRAVSTSFGSGPSTPDGCGVR